MAGYNFRWGDDVQPYIFKLGAEHIGSLKAYCHARIRTIMRRRDRARTCVVSIVPTLHPRHVLKKRIVHRFDRLGFRFELREWPKTEVRRKPEFVLHFATMPDFKPKDMPQRLSRSDGRPLSARPRKDGETCALSPAEICARDGVSITITLSYELPAFPLWISRCAAAWRSSLEPKLYKMYDLYQKLLRAHTMLWDAAKTMWRRRPQLRLPFVRDGFFTPFAEFQTNVSANARLEPRLIGEPIGLLLFTFVSREPALWDADLFGRADEGERIPA